MRRFSAPRGGTALAQARAGDNFMMTSGQRRIESAAMSPALLTVAIVGTQIDPDALAAHLPLNQCQLVIIESTNHAYSTIKQVAPHLIVLCVDFDDARGLQVLSMLKADDATSTIPVWTYLTKKAS
jgi:CheY-like chemotaxis protein